MTADAKRPTPTDNEIVAKALCRVAYDPENCAACRCDDGADCEAWVYRGAAEAVLSALYVNKRLLNTPYRNVVTLFAGGADASFPASPSPETGGRCGLHDSGGPDVPAALGDAVVGRPLLDRQRALRSV